MVRSPLASARPSAAPSALSDPIDADPIATSVGPSTGPSIAQGSARNAAFRPTPRSRSRIALGVGLLALAVVVNLAVYRQLDERQGVLQVVRDVPAGQQIANADLRTVEVSVDASVRTMVTASLPIVVGQYAKVRLVAGSLVVAEALQAGPLVGPGTSLVAITVPPGELPVGLRERSRVSLVMTVDGTGAPAPIVARSIEARVVGLPAPADSSSGDVALTLEVAATDASSVATAGRVRVVLLDPGIDPAALPDASS